MKPKDNYIQGIRGICIILVVLIHCISGIEFKDNVNLVFNYDYWIFFRQVINFPVAMFIFLSGYLIKKNEFEKNYLSVIKKRGGRLVVPFLVFSVIYLIENLLINPHNVNFVKIILKILTGKASGQLYFILVLFQLTLLTPIILRCQKSKVLNICCLMITPVYLCVLYGIQIYLHKQIIFYETFFPAWFIFYYVGIYLKQNKYFETKENNVNLLKSIFLIFITLLMSVFECYVLLNLGLPDGFATSQIKFSSFCYALAMINLLFSIKNIMPLQNFPQWMIELGNKSYGIYYVHCLWLVFLNKILLMIPIINTLLPLLQLLEASCAILISYGIIILVIRLVGKERAKFFFGF